jgi:exodeoxyribonuclease V alpha subunit
VINLNFIKGKIRATIYKSDNGFFVGIFRVKETNDDTMKEYLNRTITISGTILNPTQEETYILYGEYIEHERYGFQYKIANYEKEKPTGESAVIEFLASPLIKGCGEVTAKKIVEVLGASAIDLIKQNKNNLFMVPNMTEKRAETIYMSILAHSASDDLIIELKEMGFSITEATKIINKFKDKASIYTHENMYYFKDIIDFNKIDSVYVNNFDSESLLRKRECILESMRRLGDKNGDIYFFMDEIYTSLKSNFKIILTEEEFTSILDGLINEGFIIKKDEKYYLKEYYDMEYSIANNLKSINKLPKKK